VVDDDQGEAEADEEGAAAVHRRWLGEGEGTRSNHGEPTMKSSHGWRR
jgi:hypothetical protein